MSKQPRRQAVRSHRNRVLCRNIANTVAVGIKLLGVANARAVINIINDAVIVCVNIFTGRLPAAAAAGSCIAHITCAVVSASSCWGVGHAGQLSTASAIPSAIGIIWYCGLVVVVLSAINTAVILVLIIVVVLW